ncbi:uncharacterized protein LOC143059461 [Mytilus galloprovincialis]|uniref:uncharacterized protein LOC143059461 n=1 Tax=Mytilus galloprovincialis TaxID=29158 RepID=UPI003F7CB11C
MKTSKKENWCLHCKKSNSQCKKKRTVLNQLLNKGYNASLLRKTREVPNSYGLYCIRANEDDEVLYIGFSNKSVRKRLMAHTAGYDRQKIGKYLKGKDLKGYSISWVIERKAECLEEKFIDFVTTEQGFRPIFNLKRGRSCRSKEEYIHIHYNLLEYLQYFTLPYLYIMSNKISLLTYMMTCYSLPLFKLFVHL